jgi:hypothetical protein
MNVASTHVHKMQHLKTDVIYELCRKQIQVLYDEIRLFLLETRVNKRRLHYVII